MDNPAAFTVRDGLDLSGIDASELWCRYLALGGSLCAADFDRFFADARLEIDSLEHDVIAHALNEAFLDQGIDTYPVGLMRPEPPRVVALRAEVIRSQSKQARARSAELHAAASRLHESAADILARCGHGDYAGNARRRAQAERDRHGTLVHGR